MRPLREARFDPSDTFDVFGRNAQVMELDFELPFGDVVDRRAFTVTNIGAQYDGILHRRGSGRLRRGAVIGLLLRCRVVSWDEPRVGAKTVGGRYPSGRRSITTARSLEDEAPFTDGTKNKNMKIDASITAHLYSMSHQ